MPFERMERMETFDLEARVQQAVDLFNSGHNCAQSVFMAYADLFGVDAETASKMSVSFGGGMGRMREVCGTVSGMAMLAGFHYPVPDPSDAKARTRNYAMVQQMATLFKEQFGTIICRELLAPQDAAKTNPTPDARTQAYYFKRPCGRFVAAAARIAGAMLQGKLVPQEK